MNCPICGSDFYVMKTDKELYDYCRANYYYNQLCEQYEDWSDEDVKELIENDVEAMKRFLKEE